MKGARMPMAVVLALALLAAGAAQEGSESSAVDSTRLIQGAYFSLTATETRSREDSPFARLSPGFDEWSLSSTAYSSYSLSFRSRAVSGHIAASAQAEPSEAMKGSIKQAWVKATFGEGWGLAFGRRELAWKDGGYWNPSDLVNYRLSWDPAGGSGEAEALGRDSVELLGLLPFMDFTLDLSLATALSADYQDIESLPLYLATGTILYPFELRAKAALQTERLPLLGAALKLSLTGLDLYSDLVWLGDHPLAGELGFGPETGSWFRYCLGGNWTTDLSRSRLAKSLSLRLEYLRQDDGLSADQGATYFARLESYDLPTYHDAYAADAQAWEERFFALYRDYLFANLALGEIANLRLSLSASGLLNLDDSSAALSASFSWSPKNLLSMTLTGTAYLGPEGSEAMALPQRGTITLRLSRSF